MSPYPFCSSIGNKAFAFEGDKENFSKLSYRIACGLMCKYTYLVVKFPFVCHYLLISYGVARTSEKALLLQ